MKNIIVVITCIFIAIQPAHSQQKSANRDQFNPNRWVAAKTFVCPNEGYSISIMRKADWVSGQSPFKIQVEMHAVISEYCNLTRRNILANAYSQSANFVSAVVDRNAQVGEYCDINGNWIIGSVYRVTYPSATTSTVQTTNILHDPNIHLNTTDINDLVARFNTYHSYTVPTCYENSCSTSSSGSTKDGALAEMKKLRKLQKDLIKAHTDFLDNLGEQHNGDYPNPKVNQKATYKKVRINN
jgi:hypothetical protein